MAKSTIDMRKGDLKDEILTMGKRLRIWRKASSLNLVALSKIIHVSQGSLSDLENDNSLPSARTLANLSLYTDLDIYWLLTGKGDLVREHSLNGSKSVLHEELMFAMQDQKLRLLVKHLIRVYRHGDIQKLAHLEGFLVGADPVK